MYIIYRYIAVCACKSRVYMYYTYMKVKCLHMCDVTHSYVRLDACMRVT